MVRLIFIILALLVLGVLVAAALQPDRFEITRSARIQAPPERIFPLINDLRQFSAWSPFEKHDPEIKQTFSGARSGAGALYDFDGNAQVGAGRLSITDSVAPGRVTMQLDMHKPMEAHNVVEFRLVPERDGTLVTWSMKGPSPYVSKLLGLFMNMDRMVGSEFEQGLANLRQAAETPALASPQEASHDQQ